MSQIFPSVTGRPTVTTGSAYSAYDAVGDPFQLPYAGGGINGQINALDLGTSNAALLLHIYSRQPTTPAANGTTWTLDLADFGAYMGAVSISATDWVTAGSARSRATVTPRLLFQGGDSARSMWVHLQCVATPTFNGTANPLIFNSING